MNYLINVFIIFLLFSFFFFLKTKIDTTDKFAVCKNETTKMTHSTCICIAGSAQCARPKLCAKHTFLVLTQLNGTNNTQTTDYPGSCATTKFQQPYITFHRLYIYTHFFSVHKWCKAPKTYIAPKTSLCLVTISLRLLFRKMHQWTSSSFAHQRRCTFDHDFIYTKHILIFIST